MAADVELRGSARIEGAQKAAGDLKKIAEAQDKVTSSQKNVTDAQGKGAEAASKASLSSEEYSTSLSRISPALGGFVEGLRGAFKIAGDLGSQQISLTGIFKKTRSAIVGNAKALKTIAAGGAVAAGIFLIVKAVKLMREEFAKAHAEIKRTQEELTKIKGEESDTRAAIESVADKRKRIGGATADQSRKGLEDFKGISRQFEAIDKSNLTDVVGNTLGLGLSREQIANTAILQQSGRLQLQPDASGKSTTRYISSKIEENQEFLTTFRTRESRQGQGLGDKRAFSGRTELEAAAAREATSQGGSQTALNKLIGQKFPDLPEEDAGRLADLAQDQGTIGGLQRNRARSVKLPGTETTLLKNDEPGFLPGTSSVSRVSGSDLSRLESLLADLAKSNNELAAAIKVPKVTQNNVRNFATDGSAQKKREKNGMSLNEFTE